MVTQIGAIPTDPAAILTPQAAPVWRLPGISWTVALAFTPSRPAAVLAYPMCMAGIIPALLRGALFETEGRDGAVIVTRYRPLLELGLSILVGLAVWTVAFVPMLAISILVAVAAVDVRAGVLTMLLLLVAAMAVLLAGTLAVTRGHFSLSPVGRETPKGDRWHIASLAQRPGTTMSALLLTRRVLAGLPVDEVLVAIGADEELVQRYVRLGLTRGRGRRVYRPG